MTDAGADDDRDDGANGEGRPDGAAPGDDPEDTAPGDDPEDTTPDDTAPDDDPEDTTPDDPGDTAPAGDSGDNAPDDDPTGATGPDGATAPDGGAAVDADPGTGTATAAAAGDPAIGADLEAATTVGDLTVPTPRSVAAAYLPVFLKGMFMGMADTVPGISGGTIALVTGIYDQLIGAITAVEPRDVRHVRALATPHRPASRGELLAFARRVDLPFLLALGAGIGTAVLTVAGVVEVAARRYPAALSALFFGLIAASAVVLYDDVELRSPRRVAVAVAGAVFAFLVGGVSGTTVPHSLPVVALAGAVAICATVLPGVSGAFLLLLLGQYEFVLGTISNLSDGLLAVAAGGDPATLVGPATTLVAFGCGATVGLLTMAHAVRWALDHYRDATLVLLVSLMVGGLRVPAESVLADWPATGEGVSLVVIAALVGVVAVLAFDRLTDDMDY